MPTPDLPTTAAEETFTVYHLTRGRGVDYDEAQEVVVIARNVERARRLAMATRPLAELVFWLDPEHSTVTAMGFAAAPGQPRVVVCNIFGG
jgi:hypothetical protein